MDLVAFKRAILTPFTSEERELLGELVNVYIGGTVRSVGMVNLEDAYVLQESREEAKSAPSTEIQSHACVTLKSTLSLDDVLQFTQSKRKRADDYRTIVATETLLLLGTIPPAVDTDASATLS